MKRLLFALAALGGLCGGHSPAFAQSWTPTSAPSTNWQAVASSADGIQFVAAVNGGPIYTSADSGATWQTTSAPNDYWAAVASSADGSKLVGAATFGGSLFTSADAGATWQETSAKRRLGGGCFISGRQPPDRCGF